MQHETVQFENYPIKPGHIDVSGGIPDTFDNPSVEAAVVAVIEHLQTKPSSINGWPDFGDFEISTGTFNIEGQNTYQSINKLITQGFISRKGLHRVVTYLPTHKLLTLLFAKCPSEIYIHAAVPESELIRRRAIYS